jgi:hypothetical protein
MKWVAGLCLGLLARWVHGGLGAASVGFGVRNNLGQLQLILIEFNPKLFEMKMRWSMERRGREREGLGTEREREMVYGCMGVWVYGCMGVWGAWLHLWLH